MFDRIEILHIVHPWRESVAAYMLHPPAATIAIGKLVRVDHLRRRRSGDAQESRCHEPPAHAANRIFHHHSP
jgi:hypothetical protein